MATAKKTTKKTANPLERILGEYVEKHQVKASSNLASLPLLDFLVAASPHYSRPDHLSAIVPYLAACETSPQFFAFSAPPRHGKAVSDDTPMPTSRGWLEARDVREGDFLYGSDGKFTRVTGVFPQGEVELYRVSFSDDSSLVVCGDHQWHVRQRYYDKWYTKTTKELIDDLVECDSRKKWRIPVVKPVEGLPEDLPIDPYLLGLWLGDGHTAAGAITTMDPEIRDYFDALVGIDYTHNNGSKADTHFSRKFCALLRSSGLFGNKHVPDAYRTAPANVRLAVLQGLADTDGTVAKNGSQQSICTTLPGIKDVICELVSSLGGTYTVIEKETGFKLAYNVYFRLPNGLDGFRLQRKQNRLAKPNARNTPRRFIRSIELVGRGLARCFSVDAPDHLYCAGRDYVVTHNSVLINHFAAWMMIRHPGIKIAYGCYGLKLSLFFSDEVKDILRSNGYEIDRNRNSREEWRLDNGSLFKAVAPGSDFTGRGADLIVIDDPFKNRITAESGAVREATWSWFTGVAFTRRSPNASVVVSHTRWHSEDVIGVLDREHKRPYVNLQAVNDSGEALWPAQWPKERLDETRKIIGEYDWASLYMGEPRPRGGAVFGDPHTYTDEQFAKLVEEKKITRYLIGIDCAYTKRTHSDYSVAIVLAIDTLGKAYVVDMRRKQCEAPEFAEVIKELRLAYDGAPVYWFVGGQEKVIADFFRNSCGVAVKDVPAREDKFARAQSVAAAWNAGRVLVPEDDKPWMNALINEVLVFTGLDDPHDDIIDALASAYIPQSKPRSPRGMVERPILPF